VINIFQGHPRSALESLPFRWHLIVADVSGWRTTDIQEFMVEAAQALTTGGSLLLYSDDRSLFDIRDTEQQIPTLVVVSWVILAMPNDQWTSVADRFHVTKKHVFWMAKGHHEHPVSGAHLDGDIQNWNGHVKTFCGRAFNREMRGTRHVLIQSDNAVSWIWELEPWEDATLFVTNTDYSRVQLLRETFGGGETA
jgi:hypothetical protein